MTKILIITNQIPHYRIALYEKLCDDFEVTVAHKGSVIDNSRFKEIIYQEKGIGPFWSFKHSIISDDFDVVVAYLNVRLVNLYRLIFGKKKPFKIILNGIGVAASYTKKYDSGKAVAWITKQLVSRADASVFYDDYPVIKYSAMGVDPNKLFVAFNTVYVNEQYLRLPDSRQRDTYLFIGSLYKEKGLKQLLEVYTEARKKRIDLPNLNIVGDGPDRSYAQYYIDKNDLQDNISILGQIEDDAQLQPIFISAICSISPGQAGLSVQKSFAFGVPFLTSRYPITGGEYTSIIENVTGFFFDGTNKDLLDKLVQIKDRQDLDLVRENCREFYNRFRSPKVWKDGFSSAIHYALNKN